MKLQTSFVSAMIAAGMLATPAWAGTFFFTTGDADGRLGALSRSESPGKLETETADDFIFTETTVINGATITGLINAPLANISNVEVELYHVFPLDSDSLRPPRVRSRRRVRLHAALSARGQISVEHDQRLRLLPDRATRT